MVTERALHPLRKYPPVSEAPSRVRTGVPSQLFTVFHIEPQTCRWFSIPNLTLRSLAPSVIRQIGARSLRDIIEAHMATCVALMRWNPRFSAPLSVSTT